MRNRILLLISIGLLGCSVRNAPTPIDRAENGTPEETDSLIPSIPPVELPELEPIALEAVARFECESLTESSGLVASRMWDGVLWSHNDSGDEARIFAVKRDGTPLQPDWLESCSGIHIGDAVNVDWEDIAVDDQGNLILGATGNNLNVRRDLALYVLPEPHPLGTSLTRTSVVYRFRYPDQDAFPPPPEQLNFDCEAVFWAAGKPHLLTKRRGDGRTVLYRFDRLDPLAENLPTPLGSFPIGGLVTGADASEDGRRLAVLTYQAVWLFEGDPQTGSWFRGAIHWLPIQAGQCEAICLLDEEILISNEDGQLFSVKLSELRSVREAPESPR